MFVKCAARQTPGEARYRVPIQDQLFLIVSQSLEIVEMLAVPNKGNRFHEGKAWSPSPRRAPFLSEPVYPSCLPHNRLQKDVHDTLRASGRNA
jgi:hypothetical protein